MKPIRLFVLPCFVAIVAASPQAGAAVYSVGPAGGCTHFSLHSAVQDAVTNAVGGPHLIKLGTGELLTGGVTIDRPVADITIEGGYETCTSSAPMPGASMTIRQINPSRVFDLAGGGPSTTPRRTITLKNLRVTGGNAGSGSGGGALVSGKLELRLAGGTLVFGNQAGDGGGIGLISLASEGPDKARLLVDEGARIDDNSAARWGGGIYAAGGANITLLHGQVADNTAQRRGGGIYLAGSGTDLRIQTFGNNRVSIDDNTAGMESFSTTDGFGGAIYSLRARVLADATDSPGQHTISLSGNSANHGGAIYAEGPTDGAYAFIELRDSVVAGNYARGKGGAFYSRYAVDWIVAHDSTGPCAVLLIGAVPCSFVYANAAGNETTLDTPGGGVFFLASDSGIPRSIARVRRTLFQNNADLDGRAAIVEAQGANEYFIERSIFKGNSATGGGGNFAALFRSGTANSRLLYSTVLDNDVDRLFVFGGTTLTVTGSIFWAPGTTIWAQAPTAMVHDNCLISHSAGNVPAGVIVADPLLDARGRPRNGSQAWDWCPGAVADDADGHGPHDIPGVANASGFNDLGAYEQVDVIFTHGLGQYPSN